MCLRLKVLRQGAGVGSGGTKVETFLTERDAGQTHLPSLWSSGSNQMDVSSLRALPAQATSQRELERQPAQKGESTCVLPTSTEVLALHPCGSPGPW